MKLTKKVLVYKKLVAQMLRGGIHTRIATINVNMGLQIDEVDMKWSK